MNRRLALIAVSLMMLAIVSVWAQQGPPPLETALDTNADGKLTSDEYRPPRPPRPDEQGSGR